MVVKSPDPPIRRFDNFAFDQDTWGIIDYQRSLFEFDDVITL